jgi:hypothetical protein
VENSWSLPTGGPSGRDDLWKSPRDLLAASQSTRSRAGQATHHRRDEGIRQPIMMAPHGNAGLIGKARPRTLSVAGINNIAPRPDAAGALLIILTRQYIASMRIQGDAAPVQSR